MYTAVYTAWVLFSWAVNVTVLVAAALSPAAAACLRSGAGMVSVKLPMAPVAVRFDTVTSVGFGSVKAFMLSYVDDAPWYGNALPAYSSAKCLAEPDVWYNWLMRQLRLRVCLLLLRLTVVAPSKALTKYGTSCDGCWNSSVYPIRAYCP